MSKPAIDITRLSRDEQLDLLDQLWAALERDPQAFPLSDAQRQDLDRRLDELEREGPTGMSWDQAGDHIRSR